MTTPKRYELEDAQWDRIKGYFPPYRTGRPSSLDNRTALNAILWLMRSGAPWRDLPERHLIENFFNQLKNFRRIATRYDKLAHVYLATVYIASICILLK
ncbi:hypothetical protein B8W96_10830 [Lentilactobacillus parakefiri]|uniref:transposase n=1 Tax=Lentilactobacillus parakefiri TaxID=152332 RepID=UPI000BA574FD|nr:transposase [Lentilactobacillus parakefiri]PAK99577.1 hypothetical protein B8W96_10830 [Lentilactobacillus parakefiri]